MTLLTSARSMLRKLRVGLCVFVLAVSSAVSASALSIRSSTTPFDVYLGGNVEGTSYADLTATATFRVVSWSGSTVVLGIDIRNTAGSNWQSATVSAVGFDTAPELVAATSSGVFDGSFVGGHFPNGFGAVDVCAISRNNARKPANNCSGGNGGVFVGTRGSLQLTLSFSAPVSSVELTRFGIRWQQLSSAAYGIRGGSGTGSEVPPIPEPGAAIVFGVGALLLGACRARR